MPQSAEKEETFLKDTLVDVLLYPAGDKVFKRAGLPESQILKIIKACQKLRQGENLVLKIKFSDGTTEYYSAGEMLVEPIFNFRSRTKS